MRRRNILITICAAQVMLAALLVNSCSSAAKKADSNKDGKISTEELNQALVKAVFEAADENRNGSVTFEEWKLIFPEASKTEFHDTDLGKSGSFTLVEAFAYCEKQKTFDQLVKKIDSNGDGVIDKEEAGVFYDKMHETKGDNEVQKLKKLMN